METRSTQSEHGEAETTPSGASMMVPVVAQAGIGPNMILAIVVLVLVVCAFLFYLLRRGDEQIEEEERPELEEGEKPTADILEEREEVEEPVEVDEDMSLAEVKKAKMAKVKGKSRKGRATAGEATEEARKEHEGAEAEAPVDEEAADEREPAERDEAEDEETAEKATPDEAETGEAAEVEDETEDEEKPEADRATEDEETEDEDDTEDEKDVEVEETEDEEDTEDEEAEDEEAEDEEAEDEKAEDEAGEPDEDEPDESDEQKADDAGLGPSIPKPGTDSDDDGETLGESSSMTLPTPGDVDKKVKEKEAEEKAAAEADEAEDDAAEDDEEDLSRDEEEAEAADESEEDDVESKDEDDETEHDEDEESDEEKEADTATDVSDEEGGEDGEPEDEPTEEPVEAEKDGADEAEGDADEGEEEETAREFDNEAEPKSFERGLKKTREGFFDQLSSFFTGEKLDPDMVEEVEEVLFQADIGPRVAQDIIDAIEEHLSGEELEDPGKVWGFIRHYTEELLQAHEEKLDPSSDKPFVVLVVGVNGVGKTTTIGKMASRFKREGKDSLLVAGDTFRAGAVDQLGIWAERTGLPMHKGEEGADPASVIYEGIEKAEEQDIDIVLCDTSGRLHTDVNLMDELEKMERVAGKAKEGAPHEVHLVLDANTGQNAIQQAEKFSESLDVSGLTLTKFDGTARGGVILGVCKRFDAPVRYVGIGERVVDLREFKADEFVEALFM